ncbi:MAG: cytochrome d ubiquinol oxidase subunit II [Acidimicrobiia bacterium]
MFVLVVLWTGFPEAFAAIASSPLVATSAVAGLVSLGCVWRRHFLGARVAAATAVTAVLWRWAAGQYPYLLEGELTIRQAAADPVTLRAVLLSLAVGAVLVIPALVALFAMAQRDTAPD